jgi:predicted DNA-binding transcriptional regulator YafY
MMYYVYHPLEDAKNKFIINPIDKGFPASRTWDFMFLSKMRQQLLRVVWPYGFPLQASQSAVVIWGHLLPYVRTPSMANIVGAECSISSHSPHNNLPTYTHADHLIWTWGMQALEVTIIESTVSTLKEIIETRAGINTSIIVYYRFISEHWILEGEHYPHFIQNPSTP